VDAEKVSVAKPQPLSPQSDQTARLPSARCRKWVRRLVVVTCVGLLLFAFRAAILQHAASVFVVDEEAPDPTHVLIHGGDRSRQTGVQLWQSQHDRILLLPTWRPPRTQRLGMVRTSAERLRRFFADQGVPSDKVEMIPGEARNDWEAADALALWLQQHPHARLAILCDRFNTRRLSGIFTSVLGPDRDRVGLVALPNADYDESNWWRSKVGLLEVLHASLHLGYFSLTPRQPPLAEWDPDLYERNLQ
jgi:hypothetical protein